VPNPKNRRFVELVQRFPNFDCTEELAALVSHHGISLALLQGIIDGKILTKDDACRLWADSLNVAYVDPFSSVVTDEAIAKVPAEIARKTHALPLYILGEGLTMAIATPDDDDLIKRLSQITQMTVSPVFALPREIDDSIAIYYSSEEKLAENFAELEHSPDFETANLAGEKLALLAESESIIKLLDGIIYYAIRERATDIHIEAQETVSRIRFRVDGKLRQMLTFSRKIHRSIVCRLKILCSLNIAEARFPQDGRFSLPIGSGGTSFRLSSIPSQYGEKIVIRVLASAGKKSMLTLEKMLISQSIVQPFKSIIENPNGIIFVTGPTGSGKTTTLYAALHEINQPDVNISTIEDPIEIQLAGVTQSQVNTHIDLKFPILLRSLLRQDPDIILVGEIRDLETAKIATEAALTGHLVLATLHTNTAPQAIIRLQEIGVEPFMVAPSIIAVLAQRLAARICDNCKEVYYPSRETLLKYFEEEGLEEVPFYRGRGCTHCRGTGYRGRIAFHELVIITEEIRTLISESRSAQEITRAAAKVGYKPLRYDGLKKVLLGLTTIEEIEQNTTVEWAT
jgi:type II secretory ATPase GspE/PulE/Tfp pilus assembly ATPase PilB-like protein